MSSCTHGARDRAGRGRLCFCSVALAEAVCFLLAQPQACKAAPLGDADSNTSWKQLQELLASMRGSPGRWVAMDWASGM